jgi:hypothetical protein
MRSLIDFLRSRKRTSDFEADQNLSFGAELDRLSSTISGVVFIYAAMSVFVSRFDVRDVVVVLDDGHDGTQLFRYEGKAINRRQGALIHAPPGAYSDPTALPNDLNLLFERCRDEFAALRADGDTSSVLPGRRFRAPRDVKPVEEHSGSASPSTPDPYELEQRREAKPGDESARVLVSRLFLFVTLLNLLLVVTGVTGPARYLCGLILGVAIPGWAIVGRLKLHYAALEVGLSLASSLAILIVSAQVLITVHYWHLTVFDVVLSIAVLPSLLFQSRWPLSRWRLRR